MPTAPLIPGQHIHIVGISGFGMSAIARILLDNGYTVSGSDQSLNPLSQALQNDGAHIFLGHQAENITGAELVLMSSAIPKDNPELQAARLAGIPIEERLQFLPRLLAGYKTIAIAGTHGKTTTTGLMAHLLLESGLDPSYIVGGVLKKHRTNAGSGGGDYFVIEADEYGHMFLGLHPAVAVLTNIEYDHPDFFPTPQDMLLAFRLFLERLSPTGLLIACADDAVVSALAEERRNQMAPVQTYAVENTAGADWWATEIKPNKLGGVDFIVCHGEVGTGEIGPARLRLAGRHNVQNALAAIVAGRHLGLPFEVIAESLASFEGTARRSDVLAEAGGVKLINDYAHHPTAIRVTLRACREQMSGPGRLWAVWQPHTYTRLRALSESFKDAFLFADQVLVTEVYSVRENAGPGLGAKEMAKLIQESGPQTRYSGDLNMTAQILADEVQAGDVVVVMSAGDAPRINQMLLAVLQKRATP